MSTLNPGVLDGLRRIGAKIRELALDGGIPGAPLGMRFRGATASGPPVTGTWKPGDTVTDRAGRTWVCTAGGTPGAWAGTVRVGGDTMQGGLAPGVVALADASTIAVNAAAGNDFRVQLGGSHAFGAPSGPLDGQRITIHVQQPASGGPYTPSFASGTGGYDFGTAGAPAWSTAASAIDVAGFLYRADVNKWLFTGAALGN